MSKNRSVKTIGAAVIAATALVGTTAAGTASAAPSQPQTKKASSKTAQTQLANVLDCKTFAEGRKGWTECHNNTNRTIAFRALVVCGMGLDGKSDWLTLNPRQFGTMGFQCGESSTGVGSINWEEG